MVVKGSTMASLSGFYVGNIVRHRPKNTTALFIGNRQEANCIAPMGCVMVVGGVVVLPRYIVVL